MTPVPYLEPILNVGLVGVFLVLLATETLFITVKSHKREIAAKDEQIKRLVDDLGEAKGALSDATRVHVEVVVPTLTRVLDAERELVELRREEARRRHD